MADGLFLFNSPDLNKIGLWLNEKKKKAKGGLRVQERGLCSRRPQREGRESETLGPDRLCRTGFPWA